MCVCAFFLRRRVVCTWHLSFWHTRSRTNRHFCPDVFCSAPLATNTTISVLFVQLRIEYTELRGCVVCQSETFDPVGRRRYSVIRTLASWAERQNIDRITAQRRRLCRDALHLQRFVYLHAACERASIMTRIRNKRTVIIFCLLAAYLR